MTKGKSKVINSEKLRVAGHPVKAKPSGRLSRIYRIMWDQNGGHEGSYNLPMNPEKVAQAHFGYFEGTPVDAFVFAIGPCCGYTVDYPTKVSGMEFIVERFRSGAKVGTVSMWRYAENLRLLWEAGYDPLQIKIDEARRIGVDFWFRLSMNDWHHADQEGKVINLMGSRFYAEHPEYRLGDDGVDPSLPEYLRSSVVHFQDFAHEEVRRLRLDTAVEACERYDVVGFEYDFMRCPGYFKYDQVKNNLPIMTQFIRDTRTALDNIGKKKGRPIGLSVRVPNTIAGSRRLGLDVPKWVEEDLVDIIVPSTFFAADLEEDVREWVELTRHTSVRVNPAIEEAYIAGHTGGVTRCFYNPPAYLPLSLEMIHAIAARHWKNGADGLYVFNWFGTANTYDYDNRAALDNIGNPLRLKYKNKRYVVMRTDESFPNCLPHPRQIPAQVGIEPLNIKVAVADDLAEAKSRVCSVRIHVHLTNLTIVDKLEVKLNGEVLPCTNPMQPGAYTRDTVWQNFDVPPNLVRCGDNEVSLRLIERNKRLADELSVEVLDLELAIEYGYPNGPWVPPPGYVPRT
jgi:hypothetical protein